MVSGTKVVGYVRVSTAEQNENGYGLEAQEGAIRAECDRRGWTLLEVIRDEGVSGKSLDRPGIRLALERGAARYARAASRQE
jgi:DNA invertase Pin-like site-specific DNA recombinase